MKRIRELELLILSLISKVQYSSINYGITSSNFKGWLHDLNDAYTEYETLRNLPEDL